MSKIISILGCGWLGLSLAKHFAKRGFMVKGSTTSTNKLNLIEEVGAKPFIVNIDLEDDYTEFLDSEILVIAITSKNSEAFRSLISQIENSTIEKVVFISSTSVYPFKNEIVTENSETVDSPLAKIEELLKNNTSFSTTILRFGGLFDEQRHPGKFIKRASQLENPNGRVNLIHKTDCITCIEEIINQNVWNEIFNACSDSHPTREEFYTIQMQNLNLEAPVFKQIVPVKFKSICSKKIKKQLNISFEYEDLMNF